MRQGFALFAATPPEVIRACAREAETLSYTSFWVNHPGTFDGLAALALAAKETRRHRPGHRGDPPPHAGRGQHHRGREGQHAARSIGSSSGSGARIRTRSSECARACRRCGRLSTRIIVAALGPQMCRLAGEVADGVLFNWLTPEHARRSADLVRAGAAAAKRSVPTLYAYVRVALGPAACEKLGEEGARYAAIPAYGANFERMGVKPVETASPRRPRMRSRARSPRGEAPSTRSCCVPSPRRTRWTRTWRSFARRRRREAGSPTGRRALRRQTGKRVLKTRRIRYGLAPRW